MMEISVVVPAFNECDNLGPLLKEIMAMLNGLSYEIIVVDDGSTDNTLGILRHYSARDERIKFASLSRNFGHQAALRAGLRLAKGKCIITMDADMQHPPRLVPELINQWRSGYKVVQTVRSDLEDTRYLKKRTSIWFYRILNKISDVKVVPGSADFRLLDRDVVDVINSMPEQDFFLRTIIPWIGFQTAFLNYSPDNRMSGVSKYSLRRMISLALTGIVSNSIFPLRIAAIFAVVLAGLSLRYGAYSVTMLLLYHKNIPGWTSVVLLVSFIGAMQFLLIAVLGEYMGRILRETRGRPNVIVKETNAG